MRMPLYDTDTDAQTGGTGGTPTTPASQTTGVGNSPVDMKALETAVKELTGHVRALQSDKDKGVAKVSQDVQSLAERFKQYEKLKARGLEPEEIVERMELQELLAERRGTSATAVPPASGGGTSGQAAGDPIPALTKKLGLDLNSAEVTAAIRDHADDFVAQLAALTELAVKKVTASAAPANPAQVMSVGGGTTVGVTKESLLAEYYNLTKNIPPGEEGTRRRLDAKKAIRLKAKQAGITEDPI